MFKLIILIVLFGVFQQGNSLENGLARTPPMGWMSWQRFRCITDCKTYPDECISEKLFMRTADLLVEQGYKDAGYEYVIIDDCWLETKRDADGNLVADRERFPSGIKALSDYIHSKGLRFGLYEDYGTHTCGGYPGVIDHMEQDAKQFAAWEVDYVKLDGCYSSIEDMDKGYPEFGRLLRNTGRPMVYSCSWPAYREGSGLNADFEALKDHCNLWRNYGDIDDSWDSVQNIANHFAKNQDRFQPAAGPGHWNDPDMLLLGNYGLSYDQSKSQMAIWSILAAPLLLSAEMAYIDEPIRQILINKDVIAVSQDKLGMQGVRSQSVNNIHTWIRPVEPIVNGNFSYAVAFVSYRADGAPTALSTNINKLGFESLAESYSVTDLYDNTSPAVTYKSNTVLQTRVNPSGVQFYKFTVLK